MSLKYSYQLLSVFLDRGTKEVLQKRLKGWVRFHHLHEAKLEERLKPKWFTDYYVVIDFEATCEEHNPAGFIHEIIEFPAVLVNTRTLRVVCISQYSVCTYIVRNFYDLCVSLRLKLCFFAIILVSD